MSTRSAIIAQCLDGTWKSIYCHFDGYLDGVGRTLQEFYRDKATVMKLMDLGDVSSLDASLECPPGHSYETPAAGHTVFYGRDRGEEGTGCDTDSSLLGVWPRRELGVDYVYVWRWSVGWYVTRPGRSPEDLVPLAEVLQRSSVDPKRGDLT